MILNKEHCSIFQNLIKWYYRIPKFIMVVLESTTQVTHSEESILIGLLPKNLIINFWMRNIRSTRFRYMRVLHRMDRNVLFLITLRDEEHLRIYQTSFIDNFSCLHQIFF